MNSVPLSQFLFLLALVAIHLLALTVLSLPDQPLSARKVWVYYAVVVILALVLMFSPMLWPEQILSPNPHDSKREFHILGGFAVLAIADVLRKFGLRRSNESSNEEEPNGVRR